MPITMAGIWGLAGHHWVHPTHICYAHFCAQGKAEHCSASKVAHVPARPRDALFSEDKMLCDCVTQSWGSCRLMCLLLRIGVPWERFPRREQFWNVILQKDWDMNTSYILNLSRGATFRKESLFLQYQVYERARQSLLTQPPFIQPLPGTSPSAEFLHR